MIIIDTIVINDMHELADMANSMYCNVTSYDSLNSIAIIAKYSEAKELIENLISERGFEISSIKELGDSNATGYADEYIITLFVDEIGCEPAKDNNKYKDIYAEAVYILEDCNSKIMSHIYSENVFEVDIDEDVDCEDDCACDEDYEDYCCFGDKKIKEMSEWNKTASCISSILSEYKKVLAKMGELDELLRF